jgi:CRISPR-associated endonuclease/helicase Cas3
MPVSVLMGGTVQDPGNHSWDTRPEQPAIIIGTQDQLISRALNRGYAMSRFRWPVEFGLLNNDCLWVFDEVQLMGSALFSSAQLEAFRTSMGTWLPVHSLWMSATSSPDWLKTVDYAATVEFEALGRGEGVLTLSPCDMADPRLSRRYHAAKLLSPCPITVPASQKSAIGKQTKAKQVDTYTTALAQDVLKHHAGGRTIVICNTVGRAVSVFRELSRMAAGIDVRLLHSRFRPAERTVLQQTALRPVDPAATPGSILVTTQVIEAGVDITCQLMYTELAPVASMVQRFGRFNRSGELDACDKDHCIYWVDVIEAAASPYDAKDITAARTWLQGCRDVGPASLTDAPLNPPSGDVIRRRDLVGLFDTTPDLEGHDIDVSRYIRSDQERNVYVFWRDLPHNDPRTLEQSEPERDELCPAPVGEVRNFLRGGVWYLLDPVTGLWQKESDVGRICPGMEVLLPAVSGGYDPVTGWDVMSTVPVDPLATASAQAPESQSSDGWSVEARWVTLAEHTADVEHNAAKICASLDGALPQAIRDALERAARLHDWGKAYPAFQNLMKRDEKQAETMWAKAPEDSWTNGRTPHMRHELASGLAALERGEPFLVAYLAAAHHGKIRGTIRSLPREQQMQQEPRTVRGIADGSTLPGVTLGGEPLASQVLSLAPMQMGLDAQGMPGWTDQWCSLRDDPTMGPFRLAYLEALMKAADERASSAEQAQTEGGDYHD